MPVKLRRPKGDYNDPFAPPERNIEVQCLHCGAKYGAWEMVFEKRLGVELWWCKNPNCDGGGYGFDILDIEVSCQ